MDITGVSLDEALYYIHKGYALNVLTEDESMLVYAYDKSNVAYVSGENSFNTAKQSWKNL